MWGIRIKGALRQISPMCVEVGSLSLRAWIHSLEYS